MRRFYIDTDIFIFYVRNDPRLTRRIRRILIDYENQIYISSESLREVVNLFQCGNIEFKQWKTAKSIVDFIDNETHFEIKYWRREHLHTLIDLPLFDDHRDPFDRMILAHAITEKVPLISGDTKYPRYQKYGLELIANEH